MNNEVKLDNAKAKCFAFLHPRKKDMKIIYELVFNIIGLLCLHGSYNPLDEAFIRPTFSVRKLGAYLDPRLFMWHHVSDTIMQATQFHLWQDAKAVI